MVDLQRMRNMHGRNPADPRSVQRSTQQVIAVIAAVWILCQRTGTELRIKSAYAPYGVCPVELDKRLSFFEQ